MCARFRLLLTFDPSESKFEVKSAVVVHIRYLYQVWQSDRYGRLPEVILTWNVTWDKTQNDGLVEVCALWMLSFSSPWFGPALQCCSFTKRIDRSSLGHVTGHAIEMRRNCNWFGSSNQKYSDLAWLCINKSSLAAGLCFFSDSLRRRVSVQIWLRRERKIKGKGKEGKLESIDTVPNACYIR